MLSFVFLVIGFALMIWGADKFVAGASALARKLGVSPLLIGLTIVAFGTSMPELAVSVTAALRGANEIAVGNVVGSNIFNLLVVAGLSAAVCPLVMDKTLLRRDWPLSILAAVLLLGAIAPDLTIARWEGVVLLIIFAFILTHQIRTALQNREQLAAAAAEAEAEEAEAPMSTAMIWVNILLGLACIVIGGQLAVNGATGIARMFGLSETLIGLTIVAMGTSLPELVTSIVAARKGQNDIAMGNVIGSNLFNIFLILGVSSVITPIPVQATSIVDCLFLIAISRMRHVCSLEGLTATYEVESAALRGMGKSLEPAVFTVLGTVVFRLIWMATVFRLVPTFEMLMDVYVASWVFTGGALLIVYLRHMRRVSHA